MAEPIFNTVVIEQGLPAESHETEELRRQQQWDRVGKILKGTEVPTLDDLPYLEEVYEHFKAELLQLQQVMRPLKEAAEGEPLGPKTAEAIVVEVDSEHVSVTVTPESVIPTITPDPSIAQVEPELDAKEVIKSAAANVKKAAAKKTAKRPAKKAAAKKTTAKKTAKKATNERSGESADE